MAHDEIIFLVDNIQNSIPWLLPELILTAAALLIIVTGLLKKDHPVLTGIALLSLVLSFILVVRDGRLLAETLYLFDGNLSHNVFSLYMRGLLDLGGIFTVLMTWRDGKKQSHLAEYYTLLLMVMLGAHLLVMSVGMVMVFLSLELVSISSYVLAGFSFTKRGSEGSLKYFLFGSVASAIMLYGISILYGLTGSLDFSSRPFITQLAVNTSPLFLVAGLMTLAGFLYKIAAAPFHPWAPDVYEAAPMPVVAFFSVVPKLAGMAVLLKFLVALNKTHIDVYDWQSIVVVVAIFSLTVGNFSALLQKNAKRMMAYSSIAQSGFMLVGVAAYTAQGIQFTLFYATVYVLMSFLVFFYLQYFEQRGFTTIASFAGIGKSFVVPCIFLLTGMIALTGLPPTAGFMAKLFVFSALWQSYAVTAKTILLVLMVAGLLNTVVSLFYYLRIPYFAFIKNGEPVIKTNILTFENFFGLAMVVCLLWLFFNPGLLMSWINKITFVL